MTSSPFFGNILYISLSTEAHMSSAFTQYDNPQDVLEHIFGFGEYRPLQQEIIESLIKGEDNFVLMPTGGGKSLCYQIPAIVLPGVAIVVSPLISLMQDQVDALRANGVSAAYYNSSLGGDEARHVLAQLHQGELDLLYIAPERVLTHSFLERLRDIEVAFFAIDEAHCISQWGPDFRPEYAELIRLREFFPDKPMIAMTATADRQTRQDIIQRLSLQKARQHVASFNRPNIHYTVLEKDKPFQQIVTLLETRQNQAGIIYCSTRKQVDDLADKLINKGIKALPYHAGMSVKQRQKNQTQFQRDDVDVIVATIAFGMGIDKPNVRFVFHYNIPKHIEGYYQETGRAGRDGLPSEAIMLYGIADVALMRGMLARNQNDHQQRIENHKLNAMVGFAEEQTCRRIVLLNYFDERLDHQCGNCDICITPPKTYDATKDAQKALSCVYRVQQSFGIAHVVEVLRGSDNQRIKQFHHDMLSTYGIGKNLTKQEWNSIFRQLIHRGYLLQDIAHYSVLKLTEKSRALLRGEEIVMLAKPRYQADESKSKKKKLTDLDLTSEELSLFEKLRQMRKKTADREKVPPFVVFSDATLTELAQKKPSNEVGLLAINGIGERKLERYGDCLIELIHEHVTQTEGESIHA